MASTGVVRIVRLRVPAASAKPGPAIGQALGPLGVNMAEFCKQFNERTEPLYQRDTPLQVLLSANPDRTYSFSVKTPPTSWMLKQVSGIQKGATKPGTTAAIGYVTPEAVYEIAKIKQTDDLMWHLPLESIARSVIGTAKSMGLQVKEEQQQQEEEEKEKDDKQNTNTTSTTTSTENE